MRRSFSIPGGLSFKDPKIVLQTCALVLLAANLAAAWFVLRPLGGSAEELGDEAAALRAQLMQRRTSLDRSRVNVVKVENGRSEGDQFMQEYFLTRRTAASTILSELNAAARDARIKVKVHSFNEEPVEGSDDLSMMVISGEYEGTYADLIEYVNRIDRSPRLLIIESLAATPQQGSQGVLNISIKFDTFVREDDGLPVITKERAGAGDPVRPEQPAAQAPPTRPQAAAVNGAPPLPGVPNPAMQAQAAQPAPQNPAMAAPPTRPRPPMRMLMRKRPAETDDQSDAQPKEEQQ
jgi:Tfp pilus assembly protein PilO